MTALLALLGASLAGDLWIPDDHVTLQGALWAASEGDTIHVRASYDRSVEYIDPVWALTSVTIQGEDGVPELPRLYAEEVDLVLDTVALTSDGTDAEPLAAVQVWGGSVAMIDVVASAPGGSTLQAQGAGVTLERLDVRDTTAARAVVVVDAPGQVLVVDSSFSGNLEGALYLADSSAVVKGCAFSGNATTIMGADLAADGGGLASDAAELPVVEVTESRFTSSTATEYGGALAVLDADLVARDLELSGTRAGLGGALLALGYLADEVAVDLDGIRVDGGGSTDAAGALALAGVRGTLAHCRVEGTSSGSAGGALVVSLSDLVIDDCVFSDTTGTVGGAIYSTDASLVVKSSDFERTTATEAGGAIASIQSEATTTLEIDGCGFAGDPATEVPVGGALAVEGGSASVRDSGFASFLASWGGAVGASGADLELDRVEVWDCEAEVEGGGILVDRGSLAANDLRLARCAAPAGAAASLSDTTATLVRARVCESTGQGGGVVTMTGGPESQYEVLASLVVGSVDPGGAAIRVGPSDNTTGGPDALLEHVTLAATDAPAAVRAGSGSVKVVHSILHGAPVGIDASGGEAGGQYNLWWELDAQAPGTPLPGPHAVEADPLFQDRPDAGCDATLYLAAESPARDAGDPTLQDPWGGPPDLGAWGGPHSPLVDADGDGWPQDVDCDNLDPEVHPGADPVYGNDRDEDCDGALEESWVSGGGCAATPAPWWVLVPALLLVRRRRAP